MIVLWLSVQKLCLSYLSLPACFLSLSVSLWFPYRWLFLPLHRCLACHMMQLYPPHVSLWLFLWLSETIWHSDSLLTEMGVIFFYFLFLFLSLFMQTTKWSTMNVFQQRLSENDPLSLWGQPVNGPQGKDLQSSPYWAPMHLPASTQMFVPILSPHKNVHEWLSKRFRGWMQLSIFTQVRYLRIWGTCTSILYSFTILRHNIWETLIIIQLITQ